MIIQVNSDKKASRKTLPVMGLIAWSVAMILVGGVSADLGLSPLQAATSSSLVRLDADRLAGKNLGEYEPYDPESGDLMARGHEFFYSEDGNFGLGVWESKPGKTTYVDLEYDELMYVLDGMLIMTDENGTVDKVGPGQGLVLPTGWNGTLAVPEGGVRKIWVTYMGDKK